MREHVRRLAAAAPTGGRRWFSHSGHQPLTAPRRPRSPVSRASTASTGAAAVQDLWQWSVDHAETFWGDLLEDGVIGSHGEGDPGAVLVDGRPHAGRSLVPGRHPQLRREPAAAAGTGTGDHLSRRERRPARAELGRARERGGGPGGQPSGGRRRRRRSGRRLPAQRARGGDRHAGGGEPGCRLVVLLAGFRHCRRARPVRPDRAQGAAHRRRLPLCRQAARHPRQGGRDRSRPADAPPHRRPRLPRDGTRPRRHPAGGLLRRLPDPASAASGLHPPALRPPALRALLVGHHGPAQGHRARCRRHAAAAPQGAPAALRRPPGRAPVLLHHLRLDDVELAGHRARQRGDAGAVRRLALPPLARHPPRRRRRGGDRRLRHLGQVPRRA